MLSHKIITVLGLFMVIFASSMQDTIHNPMTTSIFILQIVVLCVGLGLAVIYGNKLR